MTITALLLQEVIMVVTISNNTITTMIGGVAHEVVHRLSYKTGGGGRSCKDFKEPSPGMQ